MAGTANVAKRATGKRAAAKKEPGQPAPKRRKKKEEAPIEPRGLASTELGGESPPDTVASLRRSIEDDGGAVLGVYREPLGGRWTILAGLPVERVAPTPFQRDVSQAHVARLTDVMKKLDRFLDPIIAVRMGEGSYWTPNGNHRLTALKKLGARSVVALVLPDAAVAYSILALNTEKAHNIREKAIEVIRMARSLADTDPRPEKDFALEFEEPSLLTLGVCYEERARFSGGPYQSILRTIDAFLDAPLPEAIKIRKERADKILALDDAVSHAVEALRKRGIESPYLKGFVVARVNHLRFRRASPGSPPPPFDDTLERMLGAADRFDAESVRPDQVARASGPPDE
jgi:ParB family chromosome partitioning protein